MTFYICKEKLKLSNCFDLNLQIPPTQDWKCSTIDVVVQSNIGGNWVDLMTLDPSQTEFEVDNLIPCSLYEYRVQLSNKDETVFSGILTFRAQAEGTPHF